MAIVRELELFVLYLQVVGRTAAELGDGECMICVACMHETQLLTSIIDNGCR